MKFHRNLMRSDKDSKKKMSSLSEDSNMLFRQDVERSISMPTHTWTISSYPREENPLMPGYYRSTVNTWVSPLVFSIIRSIEGCV